MSDCQHEKTTTDCVCTDCGYDLIVDARDDKIRKEERERIIKLWEQEMLCECEDAMGHLLALIKGETELPKAHPQEALPLPPKTPENTFKTYYGF